MLTGLKVSSLASCKRAFYRQEQNGKGNPMKLTF